MNGLERELILSTGMVLLTVLVHLGGLGLLMQLTRFHLKLFAIPVRLDRVLVPVGMVLGIFFIHGVEIWAYAILYLVISAAPHFEDALYLSLGAYTTTGWLNFRLAPEWRIAVSLESIVGLLMVGLSTAFLVQNLRRLMVSDETHPLPKGAIADPRRKR